MVQFFQRPTDSALKSDTTQTLAMVETNNMMTVAMWTTKILASNTNILAFRWLEGEGSSDGPVTKPRRPEWQELVAGVRSPGGL